MKKHFTLTVLSFQREKKVGKEKADIWRRRRTSAFADRRHQRGRGSPLDSPGSVYAYRTLGRDCHHCDPRRHAAARFE